jgi:hypothetical protein
MRRARTLSSYVQYGCGVCAPPQWRNFDASPTLRFERLPIVGKLYTKNALRFPDNVEYGDIVRGLPVADGSAEGVYCSHVLEHLTLIDFRLALKNTHRMLRHGATFRLVVPDLEYLVEMYRADTNADAAVRFIQSTDLGRVDKPRGLLPFVIDSLGRAHHHWMWDYKSLANELSIAGFTQVRRAHYHDAADSKFGLVEDPDRWKNCLGIDCKK